MSTAWEVSNDDIETVCRNSGTTPHEYATPQEWEQYIDSCRDYLDMELIEASALCGDEMSEQCEYASTEIKSQLIDAGMI